MLTLVLGDYLRAGSKLVLACISPASEHNLRLVNPFKTSDMPYLLSSFIFTNEIYNVLEIENCWVLLEVSGWIFVFSFSFLYSLFTMSGYISGLYVVAFVLFPSFLHLYNLCVCPSDVQFAECGIFSFLRSSLNKYRNIHSISFPRNQIVRIDW